MATEKILFLAFVALFIICAIVSFVMLIRLGRTRMKEIDKYIYGHEFEHDNIFFQMARLPQYITVFSSRWYAKRTGQLEFYGHFDKKFKRPFLVAYMIVMLGALFMGLAWIVKEYYV